jgi:hypothetical protein
MTERILPLNVAELSKFRGAQRPPRHEVPPPPTEEPTIGDVRNAVRLAQEAAVEGKLVNALGYDYDWIRRVLIGEAEPVPKVRVKIITTVRTILGAKD